MGKQESCVSGEPVEAKGPTRVRLARKTGEQPGDWGGQRAKYRRKRSASADTLLTLRWAGPLGS